MISFLFEEGIITVGTLSGIFTASMLNSLRVNVIEPGIENIFPSHKLDNEFTNILDPANALLTNTPSSSKSNNIVKWKTFLRDFLTWVVVMYCLYLLWKNVLHKYKK
jgi:large-conductance mechanosensitive channel